MRRMLPLRFTAFDLMSINMSNGMCTSYRLYVSISEDIYHHLVFDRIYVKMLSFNYIMLMIRGAGT